MISMSFWDWRVLLSLRPLVRVHNSLAWPSLLVLLVLALACVREVLMSQWQLCARQVVSSDSNSVINSSDTFVSTPKTIVSGKLSVQPVKIMSRLLLWDHAWNGSKDFWKFRVCSTQSSAGGHRLLWYSVNHCFGWHFFDFGLEGIYRGISIPLVAFRSGQSSRRLHIWQVQLPCDSKHLCLFWRNSSQRYDWLLFCTLFLCT